MFVTQTMLNAFRVGLWDLINDGGDSPQETYNRLAPRTITTKQAYEELQTHSGLGFLVPKNEAGEAAMDSAVPRFTKRYTPIIRALGVEWSKQSKQKDINKFIASMGPMLRDAVTDTRNVNACNLITLGFSGGGVVGPDGKALFASDHPLGAGTSGTQSNLGTMTLSGLAIEDAIQNVMGQAGDRGKLNSSVKSWNLVAGFANAGIATRAVKSSGLQGTADNDTNEFVSGMIKNVIIDPYVGFGQSGMGDVWAILPSDDKKNPLVCFRAQDVEVGMDTDVKKGSVIMVIDIEELWDILGYRGTFGTNP